MSELIFTPCAVDEDVPTAPKYAIYVSTYGGDADVYHTMRIETPDLVEMTARLVELFIVSSQFPNGRGGGRAMFHQPCYFPPEEVIRITNDLNAFVWLDDLPYYEPGDINYTVSDIDSIELHTPLGTGVHMVKLSCSPSLAALEQEIAARMLAVAKKYHGDSPFQIYGSLDHEELSELVVDNGYLEEVLALRQEMISKHKPVMTPT